MHSAHLRVCEASMASGNLVTRVQRVPRMRSARTKPPHAGLVCALTLQRGDCHRVRVRAEQYVRQ